MRNLQTGFVRAVKKSFLPIFFSISFSLLTLEIIAVKMADNKGAPLRGSPVTVKDYIHEGYSKCKLGKRVITEKTSACKNDINKRLKT